MPECYVFTKQVEGGFFCLKRFFYNFLCLTLYEVVLKFNFYEDYFMYIRRTLHETLLIQAMSTLKLGISTKNA